MGNISFCSKGKIFGVHVRYVKIERAMVPEWLTVWQSEALYKERHTLIMNMPRGLPWT